MRISAIFLIAFAFLTSCDIDPVFPLTPEIEFVSITPDEALQFQDEITLTIHFQDGDGNLGYEGDDPVNNLFVTDTRVDIPDSVRTLGYSIPTLTPNTRKPSIQGEIEVKILAPPSAKFYNPNSTETQVVFEIYLVDRAGNISNTILADPVTILE